MDVFIKQCNAKHCFGNRNQLIQSVLTCDMQIFTEIHNKCSELETRVIADEILRAYIQVTRPISYVFIFTVLQSFKSTPEEISIYLFKEALNSKDDKIIHFVLNLPGFTVQYEGYKPIQLALKYRNILVFNLLVKSSGIPESDLINLVKSSRLSFKSHQTYVSLFTIEYFDPVLYKSASIKVGLDNMIRLSNRTDFNHISRISIPFPVETRIMRFVKAYICYGSDSFSLEYCDNVEDLYSLLRLTEFLGFELN